jgi:hypothetical protein
VAEATGVQRSTLRLFGECSYGLIGAIPDPHDPHRCCVVDSMKGKPHD